MMRFALPVILASFVPVLALGQSGGSSAVGAPGWRAKPMTYTNHVVKPGETLFGIAETYYGNGYRWLELKQYNPGVADPDRLSVGQKIFVPNPLQNVPAAGEPAGAGKAPPPRPGFLGETTQTENPNISLGGGGSISGFISEFRTAKIFGVSLVRVFLFLCVFFVVHAAVQGSFVWFAAHLSFVKNVSFGKAMRATVQSEGLASILLLGFAIMGLVLVYVGTAPPGKPALTQLLTTVEGFLGSSTGMTVVGVGLVALYCFLGIRFIPGAFEIPGAQGIAVVFLAILIPHVLMLYLMGARLGIFASNPAPIGG